MSIKSLRCTTGTEMSSIVKCSARSEFAHTIALDDRADLLEGLCSEHAHVPRLSKIDRSKERREIAYSRPRASAGSKGVK